MSIFKSVNLRDLCFLGVISRLHPMRAGESSSSKVLEYLKGVRQLGIYSRADDALKALGKATCSGLILLVLSGGTEEAIVRIVEEAGKPVLLIGFEEYNSLAAMVEAYSYLSLKKQYQVYPLALDVSRILEAEQRELLYRSVSPLAAIVSLRNARIGIVGGVSGWLVYSGRQVIDARKRLGSDIVEISLSRLEEYYEGVEADRLETRRLLSVAVRDLDEEGLSKVVRLYYALRRIVEDYGLDAVTTSCFDIALSLGVTPCYAVARLNSEGIDAGCEGDVPGLATMMLFRRITGEPALMGNLAAITRDGIIIAHCTAPLRLANSYLLMPHFETRLPAGVSARLPEGRRVTVAKMDFLRNKIIVFHGRVKASGLLNPKQCRTQVVVETGFNPNRLLEAAAGNHLVLSIGDWVHQVKTAGSLLNMDVEVLDEE